MKPVPSLILETGVRAVFHTALLFSVFLLFAGHNAPGGGFVGGLVAASALVLRFVKGGAAEVRATLPLAYPTLLGVGLLLASVTAVVPLAVGGQLLESYKVDLDLPVLGVLHLNTALPFDIGVYVVVLGLAAGFLSTLGAEGGTDEGARP